MHSRSSFPPPHPPAHLDLVGGQRWVQPLPVQSVNHLWEVDVGERSK